MWYKVLVFISYFVEKNVGCGTNLGYFHAFGPVGLLWEKKDRDLAQGGGFSGVKRIGMTIRNP